MAIKDKIKELRQKKNWSQGQLAIKLEAGQKQISAYERGINIPSTEMLIKMAKTFNVSLDYLALNREESKSSIQISDRELLAQFEEIDKLNDKDRQLVKDLLNLVIMKNKFQDIINPTKINELTH